MKKLLKFQRFPAPIAQKYQIQPWNSMWKLSAEKKRIYKRSSRWFSLEYGKSLSKRFFWQIAITPIKNQLVAPWNTFRVIFLNKMWIFNNPSIVPGVLWPNKVKKTLVVKIKAFKAMSHLMGNFQKKFLMDSTMKFWNFAFLDNNTHALWSLARGLDSFRTNVLLKSGFASNIPMNVHLIGNRTYSLNGFLINKRTDLTYPADILTNQTFLTIKDGKNSLTQKQKNSLIYTTPLTKMLSSGKTTRQRIPMKNTYQYTSIYARKPFLWTSFFYSGSNFYKF